MSALQEFLTAVLPPQGLYFAAVFSNKRVRHKICNSIAALASHIVEAEQAKDVYFACSAYQEPSSRTATNVRAVRSFWIDVDSYPTIAEAQAAIAKFAAYIGFEPIVVQTSAARCHVYWPLKNEITPPQWSETAKALRRLCGYAEFNISPERIIDIASIMRPPETHNHKYDPAETVSLISPIPAAIDYAAFHQAITQRLALVSPTPTNAAAPTTEEARTAISTHIIRSCSTLRHVYETQGSVSEPLWYGAICVLEKCKDGADVVHQWSCGHPDYTVEETIAKLQHAKDSGTGPTTCERFRTLADSKCAGCTQRVTSPIQLGYANVDELPILPEGYKWSYNPPGIRVFVEKDERWQTVCDYWLYPSRCGELERSRVLSVVMRYHLPRSGWREIVLPSGILSDPREFSKFLEENHIIIQHWQLPGIIVYYRKYLQQLQQITDVAEVYTQFGWKDNMQKFVIGETCITPTGQESARLTDALRMSSKKLFSTEIAYSVAGDYATWKQAINTYTKPRMEPYLFAVLTAFGAPLFSFVSASTETGGMVSLLSTASGQGKTTALNAALSVYGHPNSLRLSGKDTHLAVLNRAGIAGNLPVAIDELSTLDGKQLSSLVHHLTQGRSKVAMTQTGRERDSTLAWRTITLASTNHSIVEAISSEKTVAEAEAMRLFEYPVGLQDTLIIDKASADVLFNTFQHNYGHAGIEYLTWLVQNRQAAEELLRKTQVELDIRFRFGNKERFLSGVIGTTITGALIAKQLNIIDVDIPQLLNWLEREVKRYLNIVDGANVDPITLYTNFVADTYGQTLVAQEQESLRRSKLPSVWTVIQDCHREIYTRVEIYADGQTHATHSLGQFRLWCMKNKASFADIIEALAKNRVLIHAKTVVVLSKGGARPTPAVAAFTVRWPSNSRVKELAANELLSTIVDTVHSGGIIPAVDKQQIQ